MQRLFLCFLIALLGLTGCGEKDKVPLPGTRIAVLDDSMLLRPDEDADNISVDVGSPEENTSWPQAGYGPDHVIPHVAFGSLTKVLWKESIGSGNGGTKILTASLVGGRGLIFGMNCSGGIRALKADKGDDVWSFDAPQTMDNVGGGIAYDSGALYATYPSGDVVKLEADTGKVLWQQKIAYGLRSAPTLRDGRIYCITSNNKLVALSQETGELFWVQTGLEESLSFVGGASPAATDLVVLAPYSSGEIHALYPGNGHSLWTDTLMSVKGADSKSMIGQMLALPVVHEGHVFVVSHGDHLVSLELRDGRRVWEKELGGIQTPVVNDDFIFFLSTNNEVVCLTRGMGRVIWSHALPLYEEPATGKGLITWVGPILAGGKLLVAGSNKQLLALSPQDGQVLENLDLPEPAQLAPIVMEGILYLLTTSGNIIAIQ